MRYLCWIGLTSLLLLLKHLFHQCRLRWLRLLRRAHRFFWTSGIRLSLHIFTSRWRSSHALEKYQSQLQPDVLAIWVRQDRYTVCRGTFVRREGMVTSRLIFPTHAIISGSVWQAPGSLADEAGSCLVVHNAKIMKDKCAMHPSCWSCVLWMLASASCKAAWSGCRVDTL